jgi:hypothetical protein
MLSGGIQSIPPNMSSHKELAWTGVSQKQSRQAANDRRLAEELLCEHFLFMSEAC